MKQEDKELLLKDLCGRLPYGVICQMEDDLIISDSKYFDNKLSFRHLEFQKYFNFYIKPYLRPMSSMTEEECIELSRFKPVYDEVEAWKYIKTPVPLHIANIKQFDFFNKYHLDWRGLIEKGLALEAPDGMYNN